jgi:hypothetical protein
MITDFGNREIRDGETHEIIRIESSSTTQPTRDVKIILSPGDFPEIPEFPDTPPNTFGDSPTIPGGEDRSIPGECPERHQEIPQGATHTQSFMTPPRSRPPVRACRKATIERAASKESPHRISARRTASPKRSRSRGNSITVSSPPNSRRIHRTRPGAFPNARVTGVATRSVTHVQSHKLCTTWPRHMRTMWNIIQISPQHRRSSPQHHRIYL